jgi:hypothetical protein
MSLLNGPEVVYWRLFGEERLLICYIYTQKEGLEQAYRHSPAYGVSRGIVWLTRTEARISTNSGVSSRKIRSAVREK